MVPVGDKKERNLSDQPFFSDHQPWLRKVIGWADYVYIATKKGENKRLKTIGAALEQILYDSGLPQS